jgi:hypothetical protein
VSARSTDESTLLAVSKAQFNELMLSFPDQHDIIMTNILTQFGLTRDGEDAAGSKQNGKGDDGVAQMRDEIKVRYDTDPRENTKYNIVPSLSFKRYHAFVLTTDLPAFVLTADLRAINYLCSTL